MLRTVPGRIKDGSAPITPELARYRAGQACAIRAGPEPAGSRRAVIDHRLSPGVTVCVGPGGAGEPGSVEGRAIWLLGGVESADRFAPSESPEPVEVLEGDCSGSDGVEDCDGGEAGAELVGRHPRSSPPPVSWAASAGAEDRETSSAEAVMRLTAGAPQA